MKRLLFVVALLAAGAGSAAGLSVSTHSGRATGMGTAVTAHLDDASTMAYNPAGLAAVNGLEVFLGDSLVLPDVRFTPQGGGATQSTEFWIAPPPHAYLAHPIFPGLVAGIGFYMPFGNQLRWQDDFVGRFLSTQSKLAVYDINPTVAFALADWLRVGAGFQLIYSTVDLRRRIEIPLPTGATEGGVKLTGSDWGVSYDVGFQVEPVKDFLYFGATYRHRFKLDFEGEAEFSDIPGPAQPLFPTQDVTAGVMLPSTLSLGLAVKPARGLRLAFDATWFEWSRLKQLAVEFENPAFNSTVPLDWHTRWNFHLGAEYMASRMLTLRGGLGYDPTPVPDNTLSPLLPDSTRLSAFAGLGLNFCRFHVDAGYELLFLQEKTSTFPPLPGTYNGNGHVLSVTVGYTSSRCAAGTTR